MLSKHAISAVLNADKYWRNRFPITDSPESYRVTARRTGLENNIRLITTREVNTVTIIRRLQSLYEVCIRLAKNGGDADLSGTGWEIRRLR